MSVGFDIGFIIIADDISFTRISGTNDGTIDSITTNLSVFELGEIVTIVNSFESQNDGTFLVTSSNEFTLGVTRLTPIDNQGVESVPVVPMVASASPSINLRRVDIICPDRNFKKIITPQILAVNFGDGYQSRIKDGVFTRNEEYSVSFINRSPEVIEKIVRFFERTEGVKSFPYVVRDEPFYQIPVICQEFSVTYISDYHSGCDAKFKRVKS